MTTPDRPSAEDQEFFAFTVRDLAEKVAYSNGGNITITKAQACAIGHYVHDTSRKLAEIAARPAEAGGVPGLPKPAMTFTKHGSDGVYTVDQMRAYALQALAAAKGGGPTEADALALELVSVTEERDFLRRQLADKTAPAAPAAPAVGDDWFADVLASAGEVVPFRSTPRGPGGRGHDADKR